MTLPFDSVDVTLPQVLCAFTNGRIEEFLTVKTLAPEEMGHPDFVPRIAAMLSKFHQVRAPGEGGLLAVLRMSHTARYAVVIGWMVGRLVGNTLWGYKLRLLCGNDNGGME